MINRHGAVELDFSDGTYTFRLGIAELEELERKCDLGTFQIARRLGPERSCRSIHIIETLRLGLIGGGMKAVAALTLVRRTIELRPLDECRDVAYAVALAALTRLHGDEAGNQSGESPDEEPSPGEARAAEPDAPTSPPSMEPPPSWESKMSGGSRLDNGAPSSPVGTGPMAATGRKRQARPSSSLP